MAFQATTKRKHISEHDASDPNAMDVDVQPTVVGVGRNRVISLGLTRGAPSHAKALQVDGRQADDEIEKPLHPCFGNTVIFTHNLSRNITGGSPSITDPSVPQSITDRDSLSSISEKLLKLIEYGLQTGKSLAMATGFLTVQQIKELDPIGNAIASLENPERDFWDAYCNSIQKFTDDSAGVLDLVSKVPVPDWSIPEVKLAVGNLGKPAKTFARRALALRFLYRSDDEISAENAKWFTMNHVTCLPLVKAVDRLQAGIKIQQCTRERAEAHMLGKEIVFLKSQISLAEVILRRRITGSATASGIAHDPTWFIKRKRVDIDQSITTAKPDAVSSEDQPETRASIRWGLSVLRDRVKDLEAGSVALRIDVNGARHGKTPWTSSQDHVLRLLILFTGRSVDEVGTYYE